MLDNNPYIRWLYKTMLPPVKQKQVIFVPKLMEPVTPEDLARRVVKFRADVDPRFALRQKKYDPQYRLCTICRKYVKIRILAEQPLAVDFGQAGCCVPAIPQKSPNIKTVVIYIHGGGFVGMSSRTHQHYTRKWAKMVADSVILSIDYRLAPEHPYPAAVDDVWQAYYWILTQCEHQLGIGSAPTVGFKPQNIVVAGDSAGGTFAMVLALRALHANVRLPDGLILGYPGTILSTKDR